MKNGLLPPIEIISLGAGVQSSTLALMSAHGEITPMPDAAIFADTMAEPRAVYEWLDWLEPRLPFPVYRVSRGTRPDDDFLAALNDPAGRADSPPFMVQNPATGKAARLWQKCTRAYKITPIRRKVRELRGGRRVIQWIGISLDEAHRMKPSGVQYITHRYPLIDAGMTRQDCLRWMERHGYPRPPKSACVFCPYASDSRLREMRDAAPDEWARVVEFDREIRRRQRATINGAGIAGRLYIHRSCRPIDQVDLSTPSDHGQADLFGNECTGTCGV